MSVGCNLAMCKCEWLCLSQMGRPTKWVGFPVLRFSRTTLRQLAGVVGTRRVVTCYVLSIPRARCGPSHVYGESSRGQRAFGPLGPTARGT